MKLLQINPLLFIRAKLLEIWVLCGEKTDVILAYNYLFDSN